MTGAANLRFGSGYVPSMRCHYCDRSADISVDKSGVRVGLCEEHFQARLDELADSETLSRLREQLDIDRA